MNSYGDLWSDIETVKRHVVSNLRYADAFVGFYSTLLDVYLRALGLSLSELEYRTALSRGLPVPAFVLPRGHAAAPYL